MPRLTASLGGPTLWVKRDDLTGLAMGGNKTRKLEFLLAEAMGQGADTVITAGAPQSNHCRMTAAAAAKLGLRCHLVLGGEAPAVGATGNLLLDELFGATLHFARREERDSRMASVAAECKQAGHRPYVIPIGGSNATGALGYVNAMAELSQQLKDTKFRPDHIVFATGSGGTHAGLALGQRMFNVPGRLLAINTSPADADAFAQTCADIANGAAQRLRVREHFIARDFHINHDYLGGGYGVVGELETSAVSRLASTEGLLVGPVYTGRALGGLMDLVEHQGFGAGERVLFWHTGDGPTLFAAP